MYPREKNHPENHRREYCSDGAPSAISAGRRIPFPQPDGIFVKGKSFDMVPFLTAVQELYQRVVVEGVAREDLSVETEAFATLLMDRIDHSAGGDGVVAFRVIEGITIKSAESVAEYLFTLNGQTYMKIGCL